jgi:hypothetical protein
VVTNSRSITVQTTSGTRYTLLVGPASRIATSRFDIPLHLAEIPVGVRVRADGTVRSDGKIDVSTLVVTLRAEDVRGAVIRVGSKEIAVKFGGVESDARLTSATTISQGSRSITLGDIVLADDVTLSGYATAGNGMVARSVAVHRRLLGESGQVVSVTDSGFVLQAIDGSYPVVVSATTVWTGTSQATLLPGAAVHVTGYVRGDGVILATRVRAGK